MITTTPDAILNPGPVMGLVAGCFCLLVGWAGGYVWSKFTEGA